METKSPQTGTSLLKPRSIIDSDDEEEETEVEDDDFLSILKNQRSGGRKNIRTFKSYALALYYNSPKTYILLKDNFKLPNINELSKLRVNFETGISQKELDLLKVEHVNNAPESSRNCVLILQKIPLRPYAYYDPKYRKFLGFSHSKNDKYIFADSVVIIMLQGLTKDWRQVIGFQLCSYGLYFKDFANIFRDNVRKVMDFNFIVHAVVADTSMTKLLMPLVQSAETPSFIIMGRQISLIFDVRDIVVNIGKYFKNTDIDFSTYKTARWKHVVEFYESDSNLSQIKNKNEYMTLAPKLTREHFDSEDPDFSMYADILSYTVGIGIHTHCKLGFAQDAEETSKFLTTIGSVIELLIDGTLQTQKLQNINIFYTCITLIKTIKNDSSEYFKLFMMTIISIIHLLTEVPCIIEELKTLDIRKLSMDPINNFVLSCTSKVEKQNILRIDHFLHDYGKLLLKSLLQKSFSEEEELLTFMNYNEKLKRIASLNVVVQRSSQYIVHSKSEIDLHELQNNSLIYISSCVYKKYLEAGACDHAKRANSKYHDGHKPTPAFITFMINLDTKFTRYLFECMTQEEGIINSLTLKLSPVTPLQAECCSQFPHKLVIQTFILLRLTHVIHVVNDCFSNISSLTVSIKALHF